MGLDMYLFKETYIGANFEHRQVKGTVDISVYDKPVLVNLNRISTIRENVAYWRKANAIHKWFVDNCQDGVDECQYTYINYEQLVDLLALCKRVLQDHTLASSVLPTQEGFFFGDTEYDDYYFEDLVFTIEQLEAILNEPNAEEASYIYHSSW
jgi:hypothetical protein